MKKIQSSNNNSKEINYPLSQSNYLNPNLNKYQNPKSSYLSNVSNSLSYKSPFSNEITIQTQSDISNNNNINNNNDKNIINNNNNNNYRQDEGFGARILTTSTIEMPASSINFKDSKSKKMPNISKTSNMPKNPKPNAYQKSMNIKRDNNNKNNQKKNKLTIEDDSDDDSEDYGNADDDDFDNILRESINIRNTQHNLNLNNKTLQNNPKQNDNPFLNKNKNKNIIKDNKIKQKETSTNDNKGKMNIIDDETENKVYNTMNDYFDKIDLESDKKDKKLKINNDFDNYNEYNLLNKNINNNNDENINKLKKNLNDKQKFVDLNDYFGDNDNLIQQNTLEDNKENEDNLIKNENFDNNNINDYNNINKINLGNERKEENDLMKEGHLDNININYDYNKNIINNNITDNNNNIHNNDINNNNFINNDIETPETNYKIDLENPETKNQFINHNIFIDNMLKEMKFLERLKSISDSRYSYFIEKYQKENYFMEKSQFENIFIDEKNIKVQSPLTLIFHYIFNPGTHLPESTKNFFETIFTKRGDKNYTMTYDKSELEKIPKYFNDFPYVNNLFNNFNRNDLNSFLEEINSWKETFTFEQQFIHPLFNFRREKSITMNDIAKVYFISPYDLIIDYHSYGSDLPLSDTFVAIAQYRFHCDIAFDCKNGKFIFKTSGQIFNTIKFIKETLLKKTIRNESNNTNKDELQINTWPPLKSVIESEDQKNQKKVQKIYEKYLMNNLDKYSKELPKEYDIFKNDNDNWNSFSDLNENENYNENDDEVFRDNNAWKKELEDKNMVILKYVMIFIILLLVTKILWSLVTGTFSFRSIFNSFLVILLSYVLFKFHLINI